MSDSAFQMTWTNDDASGNDTAATCILAHRVGAPKSRRKSDTSVSPGGLSPAQSGISPARRVSASGELVTAGGEGGGVVFGARKGPAKAEAPATAVRTSPSGKFVPRLTTLVDLEM
jgi:hypothetical protein